MTKSFTLAALVAYSMQFVACKTTAEWKQRTVYQLLTDRYYKTDGDLSECSDLHNYCGGTFAGIEAQLDYIAGMGFDAIWISPIPHNAEPDYHGYGALDWEKVNEHFGSEDELKSMIAAAHAKGIWIMLDVVANHSSYYSNYDFSNVNPLNSTEYYHTQCDITDWNDQWQVENCWLSGLPDLDQSNEYVRQYLQDWISQTISKFDFDGIRIDTVLEVPKDFWPEYASAAGVFQVGEVFNGDIDVVADYQNYLTSVFNYPMFYSIQDVFGRGQSMWWISDTYSQEDSAFNDVDALGLFVDNHDNARYLSNFGTDMEWSFKNAITFALTARGIPFFYYGSEQFFDGGADPENRESLWNAMDTQSEMYVYVKTINAARQAVGSYDYDYVERWVTDNYLSYSRGDMLVMTTNTQEVVDIQQTNVPYQDGTEVCNIFWPDDDCQTVTDGTMQAYLQNGESKIWLPKSDAQRLFSNNLAQE